MLRSAPRMTPFPYTTLFRSHGSHAAAGPGITEVTDGVARQLQLVTNGQHIRRLQLAMHQIPVVQKRERSEEHTSELQSLRHLVCRLLLENKNRIIEVRLRPT